MSKIIIACGGTGGHLAPGIAVAEVLEGRGHKCLLLISKKQVDSVLVNKYKHLEFVKTSGRAFAGGIIARIAFLFGLISGFLSSWKLLKKEDPDLVLLFGGYLSLGLGLASKTLGIPVLLHEANSKPGRAVRLLKSLSSRIYLPDEVSLSGVPNDRIRHLGYPVRKEISCREKEEARRHLGLEVSHKLLLVIGGSQGAAALNDWVVDNFARLAQVGVSVYCVAGLGNSTGNTLHEIGPDGDDLAATFVPFSDCMGDLLSAADIVVSRAGAGSIAEIIRCRAPSILVPYPYAADDHQLYNAQAHERAGAGILCPQSELKGLAGKVMELISNDALIGKIKSNLESLDRFESSERIASDIIDLCVSQKVTKDGGDRHLA